jgi:RNA polymerase sigma factor (TIGR02999 family)
MPDVTAILSAIQRGDPQAADQLLPLVYDELRQLAAQKLASERPGHTLQPTALVHEAYLRLVGPAGEGRFDGRGHFFAAAAQAMRRILVDHARRRQAAKRRAGGRADVDLDCLPGADSDADLLAVDDALGRLAAAEPRVAELVTLRYFGGMTVAEAAAALSISPRTADAWWAYARAWLAADLGGG